MNTAPELWTPADFAAFAKLSPGQVKRLRLNGKGPAHIRLGKHVRYIPGVVTRWASENQTTTTKEPTK